MLFAFGTEVWSVASRAVWQHGPALLFLAASLHALLRTTQSSDAAAGALLCLAILTRSTNVLLAVPLVAWAAVPSPRRLVALAAGAAPPALLHAAYAWHYWGSPLSLAQPVGPQGFTGDMAQGLAGILVGRTGKRGDVLKIRPPLVFTNEHSELVVAALDRILG